MVCHLQVLASGEEWPRQYIESPWERMIADLNEVPWTTPDKEKVLEAAGKIEDRDLARGAWMAIAAALADPKVNSYWRHDEAIAQAALALARLGFDEDARRLLKIVAKSKRTKNYFDFDREAYAAAAEKALRDPGIETHLQDLFQPMKKETASPGGSAVMALVAAEVLAKEYDGIVADETSRRQLLEICLAIDHLNYRSTAIQALVEAKSQVGSFELAACPLTRVPLAGRQAVVAQNLMSQVAGLGMQPDTRHSGARSPTRRRKP